MENKGLIVGGGCAAIALWAFLSLTGTHDAERQQSRAAIDRDNAEFDRDFAHLSDADKARKRELDERAANANATLENVQKEADQRRKAEQVKRDELQRSAESDIKSSNNTDLAAALKRLEKK
ncbi:MAG: hypothetical protein ACHP7O_08440 [Burkholderiales bacterium]